MKLFKSILSIGFLVGLSDILCAMEAPNLKDLIARADRATKQLNAGNRRQNQRRQKRGQRVGRQALQRNRRGTGTADARNKLRRAKKDLENAIDALLAQGTRALERGDVEHASQIVDDLKPAKARRSFIASAMRERIRAFEALVQQKSSRQEPSEDLTTTSGVLAWARAQGIPMTDQQAAHFAQQQLEALARVHLERGSRRRQEEETSNGNAGSEEDLTTIQGVLAWASAQGIFMTRRLAAHFAEEQVLAVSRQATDAPEVDETHEGASERGEEEVDSCLYCHDLLEEDVVNVGENCQHRVHAECRGELMENDKFKNQCFVCEAPLKKGEEEKQQEEAPDAQPERIVRAARPPVRRRRYQAPPREYGRGNDQFACG